MIVKPHKESRIIYQSTTEDMPVPEPAILVEVYTDIFNLSQEGATLAIGYETIPDLIKVLRELKQKHCTN